MHHSNLREEAELLHGALRENGAFLVTLDPEEKPNPMTIGWGLVGIAVRAPMFSIYLTKGGYTHEYIRDVKSFTVSVPKADSLTDELGLCGSQSGRDVDKLAEAGLTLRPGQKVPTPTVGGCALYYECEKLRFSERENGDVVVFGQIVATHAGADPSLT